jgi:uncharacterized membrane-anchored protein YhcB (DUF1043 family)
MSVVISEGTLALSIFVAVVVGFIIGIVFTRLAERKIHYERERSKKQSEQTT